LPWLPQPGAPSANQNRNDDDGKEEECKEGAVEASLRQQQQQQQDQEQPVFRYVRHDEIGPTFFPSDRALGEGTLCWVLLSKGKGRSSQLSRRARVLSDPAAGEDNHNVDGAGGDATATTTDESEARRNKGGTDQPDVGEPTGVRDDGRRVLVRYPAGSTYKVRRSNLLPVLELEDHLVLVAPETTEYRRLAVVHTRREDHFLEVGCDFGALVDSVDAATALGVDKSDESIMGARQRHPRKDFVVGDVFDDDDLRRLTAQMASRRPLVVAIDINGNRELPAVLRCIQLAMDSWSPRLVVVKSRELYAALVGVGEDHGNGDDVI
jgi:hypothetical protein